MQARPITTDDVEEAGRVFAESLGSEPSLEPEQLASYWDLERTEVVADDRGRILGVASGFPSRLTLAGGAAVTTTGVPNVGVRADAQGRGVGRQLLERQVLAAAERGDAALALNASEVGIYGRFGYGPTSPWWSVRLDPRRVAWHPDAPVPGDVEDRPAEEARDELVALYARCFGAWPGEVERHTGWWDTRLLRRPWHKSRLHVLLQRDASGEVDAAAVHTVENGFDDAGFANTLTVHDLFGVDATAQARLLRWLTGTRLAGAVTVERLDPGSPLPWMLADSRQARTTELGDAVWVRVLDPAAVVGGRATLATGRVVLGIDDPLVPVAAGTWVVTGDGTSLTCERTDEQPQVTLGVDLLAPLVWSWQTARLLAGAGRMVVHDPAALAVLDGLLAWHRPSWCSTSF